MKMMITGSNLKESQHAVDIAKQYRTSLLLEDLEMMFLTCSQREFVTQPSEFIPALHKTLIPSREAHKR